MYYRSDSQEKLMKKYIGYQAEDPLNYKEFDYDKNEWDNIPLI